jgi:hypothetical protein
MMAQSDECGQVGVWDRENEAGRPIEGQPRHRGRRPSSARRIASLHRDRGVIAGGQSTLLTVSRSAIEACSGKCSVKCTRAAWWVASQTDCESQEHWVSDHMSIWQSVESQNKMTALRSLFDPWFATAGRGRQQCRQRQSGHPSHSGLQNPPSRPLAPVRRRRSKVVCRRAGVMVGASVGIREKSHEDPFWHVCGRCRDTLDMQIGSWW